MISLLIGDSAQVSTDFDTPPYWHIAAFVGDNMMVDSRALLEELHFVVIRRHGAIYIVIPPFGWKIRRISARIVEVVDETDTPQMRQYAYSEIDVIYLKVLPSGKWARLFVEFLDAITDRVASFTSPRSSVESDYPSFP